MWSRVGSAYACAYAYAYAYAYLWPIHSPHKSIHPYRSTEVYGYP